MAMGLMQSLRRDVSKEFAVSRNLQEPLSVKCFRLALCGLMLCKAMQIGLRSMRRECLGSQVVYNGRKCFISNYARSDFPTLAADGFYQQNVPRSEIRNVVNLKELWHRFTFGVTFYTGYHMNNNINKRLYPTAFAR